MRVALLVIIALALVTGGACTGAAAGAQQFDLVCKGQMSRNGAASAFDTRLHVDLGSGGFCYDSCLTLMRLTEASPVGLAYRFDVDTPTAGRPASQVPNAPISSAGPFPQQDDLTIDRRTGAFRRTYHYDMGDPAARPYVETYTGQCQAAPYTGLAARAG
jgi:hypothetical protein